jgi:hypothetical protein
MGMKPRLGDRAGVVDSKTATQANRYAGEETNANIPNTATKMKPVGNTKLDPNLVSGPKKAGA